VAEFCTLFNVRLTSSSHLVCFTGRSRIKLKTQKSKTIVNILAEGVGPIGKNIRNAIQKSNDNTCSVIAKKNTAGRRDVLTFDNKLERVTEPGGLPISCRIQSVDKVRGRYDKAGRGIENFLSGKIICTGAYISTQR